MFFFKKKIIVVDCLTSSVTAHDFHPIEKTSAFLPEYWKKLPAYNPVLAPTGGNMYVDRSSLKRCPGFVSLYKQGAILPMWADMQIKTTIDSYEYLAAYSIGQKGAEHHNEWQYGNTFANYIHMKIISPWAIRQNRHCNFLMSPVIWNTVEHWSNFKILPGVVDFEHQHSSHINLFLEKNREKILISAGTPLYQIVPLTDNNVEFKTHLVDPAEINKLFARNPGTFNDNYNGTKRADLEKKSKCPFRFKNKENL